MGFSGMKRMTLPGRRCGPRAFPGWLLLSALAGFLWIGPGAGLAQPRSRTADIGELASVLLRKHPYLFDEQTRNRLEATYREYRLTEAGERKRAKPGRGTTAAEPSDRAQRPSWPAHFALVHFLDTCPGLIRLDLRQGLPETTPRKPIELPGSVGALLLQVVTGREKTRYLLQDYSLSGLQEVEPIRIEAAARATTWVLLSLSGIPSHRTSLVLELHRESGDPVRLPLVVKAPTPARLKVRVLSADTGLETPAMVRLVWKPDGRDYRPSNALDLVEQFDGHGSSQVSTNLPGRLRGDYWCVPGPFDMALPPGEWEIAIRRGLEHLPLFDTITLKPGERLERTYRPQRWVDMRKLGWFSGDDHVHFRLLSDEDAQRLMTWVQAEDLYLANVVEMGDINRTYFWQRGFGREHRVVSKDHVLSPGQECPRTHARFRLGHALAMNTTSLVRNPDRYFLYDWMFDRVHRQGGLTGYAHVHRTYPQLHRDMSINVPKNKVDFVELMQIGILGTNLYYEFLDLGFKLTAAAGSDVPFAGTVGEVRMYAYAPEAGDGDAWFEAVRQGRTFVTNGPMLELEVGGAMPGAELPVEKGQKVRVRARAWGHPERSRPSRLEIVRHGQVIRHIQPSHPAEHELRLSFELEGESGYWIAARAEGADGSRAHTTPVYVVRKPLRFWNYDRVERLIATRLHSLDEVEGLVARARAIHEGRVPDEPPGEGEGTAWWEIRRLAEQGPELLVRVAEARGIYEQLRQRWKLEGSQRMGTR